MAPLTSWYDDVAVTGVFLQLSSGFPTQGQFICRIAYITV